MHMGKSYTTRAPTARQTPKPLLSLTLVRLSKWSLELFNEPLGDRQTDRVWETKDLTSEEKRTKETVRFCCRLYRIDNTHQPYVPIVQSNDRSTFNVQVESTKLIYSYIPGYQSPIANRRVDVDEQTN